MKQIIFMKNISILSIFSLLWLLSTTLVVAQPGQGSGGMKPQKAETNWIKTKYLDLAYASKSPTQKLDIYLPNEGVGPFPVIISIHGGAFKFGDKADGQLTPMLEGLKHGYAVIGVNYRLSGEALYPAQINDIKAAIRFLRANTPKYNLDGNKFAVWGGSAGGNLAAMAGTSGDVKELEDLSLGNAGESSRVQAVVDWFGPIDFLQMDPQFIESGKGRADHNEAGSPESMLLGKQITSVPGLVKLANPTTYISEDDPPFLIQHGTEDMMVPTQQSENFAAALQKVTGNEKVTLILLKGANHGGKQFEEASNLKIVFEFLDKSLK
jgi:acetyl esterase/lipase